MNGGFNRATLITPDLNQLKLQGNTFIHHRCQSQTRLLMKRPVTQTLHYNVNDRNACNPNLMMEMPSFVERSHLNIAFTYKLFYSKFSPIPWNSESEPFDLIPIKLPTWDKPEPHVFYTYIYILILSQIWILIAGARLQLWFRAGIPSDFRKKIINGLETN